MLVNRANDYVLFVAEKACSTLRCLEGEASLPPLRKHVKHVTTGTAKLSSSTSISFNIGTIFLVREQNMQDKSVGE